MAKEISENSTQITLIQKLLWITWVDSYSHLGLTSRETFWLQEKKDRDEAEERWKKNLQGPPGRPNQSWVPLTMPHTLSTSCPDHEGDCTGIQTSSGVSAGHRPGTTAPKMLTHCHFPRLPCPVGRCPSSSPKEQPIASHEPPVALLGH